MITTIRNKIRSGLSFGINTNGMDESAVTKLRNVARSNSNAFLAMLESSKEGLSPSEAEDRLKKSGFNEIQHQKAPSWIKQLAWSFITPFNGVLFFVILISLVMDVWMAKPGEKEFKTVVVLSIMVLFSSLLRFWQEFRSNKAAEKLQNMIKTTGTVLRKGSGSQKTEIRKLVPGDIVFLSAGDMIPGDCRIIQSKDLFISQSILTGESFPVEKREYAITDADTKSPLELENICFMGTNVLSGTATAMIVTTGSHTWFGTISRAITGKRAETSFDKGVNSVSWLLIRFMLVMVPLVFVINGLTKGNWMEAFLFAVAVAVGLTPEMLPMIVTANLARGAVKMSRRKVIVKRLNAIQNIGAMDVLCTDKTGTLTIDKIVLEKHLNAAGEEDEEVLKWAYLNSYHQTGLINLMDKAVLEHVEVHEHLKVEEYYKKIDEIPFDFQRRRMSVILEQQNHQHLLICKGAVEEVLSLCTHTFEPGKDHQLHVETDSVVPITAAIKQRVLETALKMNEEGLRVLLVAIREYDKRPLNYAVADESEMILTGFIGFLDPAKPSARPAIQALQQSGISIKVLTGDNEAVTRKICNDVGIPVHHVLTGTDVEKMNDTELQHSIDDISILARLSPMQKSRIVRILQAKGHTVGFMGDGINDAAALRDADVGISVDTGADIAKESADIILLEKDLMVLRRGVVYGRRTFGNIIKYIKMTASSNFGNMFSMLGASAMLPFLPMLPVHLLVQNLLYDISQSSIPWDRMDDEYIRKPGKWEAGSIARFMFFIGPISSVFDYATFALMYFFFKANSPEHQTLFQSGWFIEGLLSQTLIVHMIRTRKIPFLQSVATTPVIVLTALVMITGIYIPFSPFAAALKMQPLPLSYFPWLLGILLAYCILTQVVKGWFIKKFNSWL